MFALVIALGILFCLGAIWLVWLCLRPMTVSFTFDDGLMAHLTIAAPLLEKYGWRGAFNVCTDFLEENPPSLTTNKLRILGLTEHPECRMNWDDVRELLARGHEVYPHSCSHENLEMRWNAGDHDLVKHEIHDSIVTYCDHIGSLPRYFCCPHLGWTPEVRNLIRAEGVEMFNNGRPGFRGKEVLAEKEASESIVRLLCRLCYEGRRHVDLMFHGIVAREGGYEPYADETVFEAVLRVVSQLEKVGKVRVVPYHEAHHGSSLLADLLDLRDWFLNKLRRVCFRLLVRDRESSSKWNFFFANAWTV